MGLSLGMRMIGVQESFKIRLNVFSIFLLFSFLCTWNLEFIFIYVLETLTIKLLMIIGFDFTYWLFKDSFAFYVVIAQLLGKDFASA